MMVDAYRKLGAAPRRVGQWFFSGPIYGIDRRHGTLPDDPAAQARFAFDALFDLLDREGLSPDHLGHMLVWQKDRRLREALNAEWTRMFPNRDDRPARHVVVRSWTGAALLALEVIAIAQTRRRTIVDLPGLALSGGGERGLIPLAAVMDNVMFSGATPGTDRRTGSEPDEPATQIALAFENTQTLLEAGGFATTDVGHVLVWQRSAASRSLLNEAWHRAYLDPKLSPSRHDVTVDLPLNLVAQLEFIAVRDTTRRTTVTLPGAPSHADRMATAAASTTLGNVLFTSAIQGSDPVTGTLPEDAETEVPFAFANSAATLNAAGFRPEDVGQVHVWRRSAEIDPIVDREWLTLFPDAAARPARHDIIADLPGKMNVQLELIAVGR